MSGNLMGDELSPTESGPKSEGLPHPLTVALNDPPIPPKGWQQGIAPAFLALGLGVVFLDRLAVSTLMIGGLGPSIVGAVLGGLLSYWCLYYAPAMWGNRARRPLAIVATSTFGSRGAILVPGLLLGVVFVVWFAITIDYAVQYTLSGLSACGLLDARHLAMNRRAGFDVPKPLFLAVAATWSLASAVIGTLAIRLVSAVMSAYIVFPAIAIGAVVVWAMPTVSAGPIETVQFEYGGGRALAAMVQLVFAYLACQGLIAADWGAATSSERDVRNGGIAGVMLGIPVLAILGLLVVAGSLGRMAAPAVPASSSDPLGLGSRPAVARIVTKASAVPVEPPNPTLRDMFLRGIGGKVGAVGLFVMALGLLGPACSNPYVYSRQFWAIWPRVPRWGWSVAGAFATWPLIATGATRNVEVLFGLIGGLAAPAVGAMAADFARSRGAWLGPRLGINFAGILGWAVGVFASYAVARWGSDFVATRYLPSSIAGFATAFLTYLLLALTRLEPTTIAIPKLAPTCLSAE